MNGSLGLLASLLVGVGWQFLTKWAPAKNWAFSFLMAFLAPPVLTGGLLCGIWICSAFIVPPANLKGGGNNNQQVGWKQVIIFSLWLFAAFLLTLVFLVKLKWAGIWEITQCQWFAWSFLAVLDLCLLRVIALLIPRWLRIEAGMRIGFFYFLLLLYWLYPYGWVLGGLTFLTLVIVIPLALSWLAFSSSNADLMRGRNK
jgi:hypothetical protein